MWSHRLTFIGLLYTEREIFVVMSSGDEVSRYFIQLFYFRNYETDFGCVRLQIMVFITLNDCNLDPYLVSSAIFINP